MALREEMARGGAWLFRWRSYLPLVALCAVLVQCALRGEDARVSAGLQAVCLGLAVVGLVIRAFAVGHAPSGSSGRNTRMQQADCLNTTGMYSVVRHPLYLGNYLTMIGIALFGGDWRLALILALVFLLYYERIMYAEEEFLRERYGDVFVTWAARTPAFLPALGRWRAPDTAFNSKRVLRREYSGWFATLACFSVLAILRDLIVHRRLEPGLPWFVVLGVGTLLWLAIRTLKHRTRVLT